MGHLSFPGNRPMQANLITDVGLEFSQAFLSSLGIGLLMGMERERNPSSRAGLRTFALTALLGTLGAMLSVRSGTPWLLAVGFLLVGGMMLAAYVAHPDPSDPGTTSVVALLLCYCFGAMTWYGDRTLAVMLATLVTALLYFKAELRNLSQNLTRRDLISMLQFATLSLVILPILPNQGFGPYSALNPYQIWWMVVLISGVSLAGYAALRVSGQQHGAPLMGILGGLASSTATTLIFSRHAKAQPALAGLSLVVILIANVVVMIRLVLITLVVQPDLVLTILPMLACGTLVGVALIIGAWKLLGARDGLPEMALTNPAEIRTALTFGCIYAVVLALAAWLSDVAGAWGLYGIALVSGLTDVDAITLSSLRLYGLGKLPGSEAVTAILLALLANLVFKLGIVFVVAGAARGRRIAIAFSLLGLGSVAGWALS